MSSLENEAVSRVHREDAEFAKVSAAPCPRLRKQTGARADREADETAKVTPAAILLAGPRSGTGSREKGQAGGSDLEAQEGNNRSADQPSSSGREATTRSKSAPKRNDKPTTAQRTRVAAAQSETSTPPTPPPAAANPYRAAGASLCRLGKRTGNVCLSGAADRRERFRFNRPSAKSACHSMRGVSAYLRRSNLTSISRRPTCSTRKAPDRSGASRLTSAGG